MHFRRAFLPAVYVFLPAICFSQTAVKFSSATSTSGETPANIYAVDVNNDGLTDIIQDTALSPAAFTVSINNGNGSFRAPVQYNIPVKESVPMPIITGDFNNDGKVDVAVVFAGQYGNDGVAVYLGNGDGTFQSPKISTIALPAGYSFTLTGPGAIDLNGDGKLDLAVSAGAANNGPAEVYTLQGDGTGGFITTPHPAFAGGAVQIVVGDFDSDGKADIALTQQVYNSSAGYLESTTVHVLYGNGNFTFDDTTPYTTNDFFYLGSGDLNSDGITDLFGTSTTQLGVFYATRSRTFGSYFTSLPPGYTNAPADGVNWNSQLAMADFNGDTHMDLVAFNYTQSQGLNLEHLAFFLAGANPGEFTTQIVSLPNSYVFATTPVVGLLSGNMLTPDVALNQSPNGGGPPQNTPSYLDAELNRASSGYFGPCAYSRIGEGFNVCAAGVETTPGSSELFSAAVNSFGKLRKIELWVDGKKVQEQHHTWDQHAYFDWSGSFSVGKHAATFYAADVDNRLQRYDFSFTASPAN